MTRTASKHPLDNPVWWALTTGNSAVAQGNSLALRFSPDLAPFAATLNSTPNAQVALGHLIPSGGRLLTVSPAANSADAVPVLQMVATKLAKSARSGATFDVLSEKNAVEMHDLVA